MNKNPLLIKSSMIGKIPFMKGKTAALYKRYLSNHRFSKMMDNEGLNRETVSAFTMGSEYQLRDNQYGQGVEPRNFVFDETDINPNQFFTEGEWVALGMVLRAYKEVEGINLMHLYNCLYSGESNKIKGYVVSGRTYTLYSSTQLPVKISVTDPVLTDGQGNPIVHQTGSVRSLSRNNPTVISINPLEGGLERLLNVELEFTGITYQPTTLVEGVYRGLSHHNLARGTSDELVPENLGLGRYSDKLVEFFSGTLITPLSDPKLVSNVAFKLPGEGSSFKEKVIENTKGFYNQDGYLDRRNKV